MTAAAIIIRKEKDLVAQFRQARALTPETAQSPGSIGADDSGIAFRRLRDRAILREASVGRYYLDDLSWEAYRRARRRMAMVLLLLVVALLVTGIAAAWWK